MRVYTKYKTAVLMIFFGLLTVGAIAIGPLVRNQKTSLNSEASSACTCTDSNVCYPDGCSRKPKTEDNRFDEGRYDSVCKQFDPGYRIPDSILIPFCSQRQPDCCFDVYKYKDSRFCCWQERYSCHPSLCEGSSGGDGCGKYWHIPEAGGGAYGCVKPGPNGEDIPMWGLPPNLPGGQQPTNTPVPTNAPPVPTNTSVPPNPTHTTAPNQPTNTPPPTNTPVPNAPTNVPTNAAPTQQTFLPPIGINPQEETAPKAPKEPFNMNILPDLPSKQEVVASLETTTAKPLAVVNTSYDVVVSADQQLESFAKSWIDKLGLALLKVFNQ